ncbi:TPA: restriction endonuclease subunit S [Streptococcus suis]|nr:restriction endonuclease subunit S [Streptococcus suis]
MKTNNNIPAYRFQGYTDAWELRKIFEIADRFNNLRVPIASSLRIPGSTPYYGANGIQDYVEGYTHNGEFVLIAEDGANDLKNYPVNLVNGKIWVNNHAHVLQGKENITNNKFLAYSINRANIEALLVGGGRAKLNSDVLMNIKLEIPSLKEQEVIGTFFSTLDRHITLHQRKLDTLKEQKKTYLKLLFPAKGQTKPALRFQGFEDDWEEVKLSDMILHEIKGKAKSEMLGSSAVYLETEYLNGGTKSFVDCEKDVEEDDILILWDGSQAGTVYHGFSGALGSTLKAYRPKESGKFIYYQLVSHQNLIFEKYRTPNIPHVIKTFTDEFHMFYTSHPEQEAIGSFFQTLDQEISQVEDKLASLKEMKKTLLRKLFV